MFKKIVALLLAVQLYDVVAFQQQCEDACKLVQCDFNGTADACLKRELAYVLPDSRNCCGSCACTEDVVDPMKCSKKLFCNKVKCAREYPNNCKSDEVLVPADGHCFCCPICLPMKDNCAFRFNLS